MVASIADISKKATIVFDPAASVRFSPAKFKYGWCEMDHKGGRAMPNWWRSTDYCNENPYSTVLRSALKKLGLPFPKPEDIFRGSHHDMLFLNSHGVIIRIGPLNILELMNPAIIQPLGWIENRKVLVEGNVPFTVAIYPGIEFHGDPVKPSGRQEAAVERMRGFLNTAGHATSDINVRNSGVIRVLDEKKGKECAVWINLDPDNEFQGISAANLKAREATFSEAKKETANIAEAFSKTMQATFGYQRGGELFLQAFEAHAPLRNLFWESFKGKTEKEMPDAACMQHFWNTCERVTKNPASCVMPVWRTQQVEGKATLVREEAYMPHVVLYRPWTGLKSDQTIVPIIPPAVKAAVKKEQGVVEKAVTPRAEKKKPVT